MKKIISAVICAVILISMITACIPATAAVFYDTAELLELLEHIEYDADMNDYATVQGACTDGRYAYFAVQQSSTVILKYDTKTWKLKAKSDSLNYLGHANDMTYNPKKNWILVANNGPEYNVLTVIDPDTFEKIKTIKLKLNVYSVAYNPDRDIYVVGISGGYKFATLNSNFKVLKKYKGNATGYTRQGSDCDKNYIYFPQSGGNNIVAVYDYSGKYVDMVSIGHSHEVENLFHIGSSFYTTLHYYGNSVHRIGLSDSTQIRFTVKYDPGDSFGEMKATSVHYGERTPLRANGFWKTGYFFGGWRARRSSDGKYLGYRKFSKVSEWLPQKDVYEYDLYADRDYVAETVKFGSVIMTPFWIRETYDVRYDPGDSDGGWMAWATVGYYKDYEIPENGFEKDGYIFVGFTAYRDYDNKYYGYRKNSKEAQWLEKQDLEKEYFFKPGEQFNAMTYDSTVYLTPVFRFAYTFSDDHSTLLEYIGADEVVNIPNPSGNLNTIAGGAFNKINTCVEIHVPDTVERIESGAINDCSLLERVYFYHLPAHYALDGIKDCNSPSVSLVRDGQTFLLGFAAGDIDARLIRLNASALRAAMTADAVDTEKSEESE